MKTNLLGAFVLILMLTASGYAQDSTAMSKKEIRRQERAERKARLNGNLKTAGQGIGGAATEVGQGARQTAKDVGNAVSTGVDKAGNAIQSEADKIKAKRDSSRAEKARRDSL